SGMSLPSHASRKQARLLVAEDQISLPSLAARVPELPSASVPVPAASQSGSSKEIRGVVLVTLSEGPLASALAAAADAANLEVRLVTNPLEAMGSIEG